MLRILPLLAVGVASLSAQEADPSRIVMVDNPGLVSSFEIDRSFVSNSFNRLLARLTYQKTSREAWSALIKRSDTVAIKVNPTGGARMGSQRLLVETIVQGLMDVGVPTDRIIIWDKDKNALTSAGFFRKGETPPWRTETVIGGSGFDPKAFYHHGVVGKVIWGDLEFKGAAPSINEIIRRQEAEDEGAELGNSPISNRSYFARIVSREATKIINIASLADHPRLGIEGCMASLSLDSVDNHRRFLAMRGDPAIPEILQHEIWKDKVVLHVLDGLIAQFAGGPRFVPHYSAQAGILMMSHDPVSLDAVGAEYIETWRSDHNIVPIAPLIRYIDTAERTGLGHRSREKIKIEVLKP